MAALTNLITHYARARRERAGRSGAGPSVGVAAADGSGNSGSVPGGGDRGGELRGVV